MNIDSRVWRVAYEDVGSQNGEQDFRVVCVNITKMQLLQGIFFFLIIVI